MCTNIFSWNVRGFNDQDKHHPFVQWLALHKPLVGVILETHIKEPNLNPILSKVCPNWSFCSNHDTDEDGRIIVIWKYPASVQVMHQSRQSLTCEVSIPRLPRFTFTVVYASNLWEERHTLWGELQEIQTTLFLDHRNWIIGGDFNQITHHHEHSSPSVDQLTSAMIELQDHFLNLGVNDLRFQGSHHTWTNKCPAAPTTKKMDRALVSGHWIEAFPGSVASFLPYEFSDHTPYLIDLSCPLPSVGTRPFKYFNFLPNHPSFLTAVENAWVLSGSTTLDLHMLGFKLKSIKRELKTLNRERFSDIEKRVLETNSLLKDVQVQALAVPTPATFKEEKELMAKWTFLRGIEEAFVKQKLRINWLRLRIRTQPSSLEWQQAGKLLTPSVPSFWPLGFLYLIQRKYVKLLSIISKAFWPLPIFLRLLLPSICFLNFSHFVAQKTRNSYSQATPPQQKSSPPSSNSILINLLDQTASPQLCLRTHGRLSALKLLLRSKDFLSLLSCQLPPTPQFGL